jgi:hypothetical protein
LRQRDGGRNIEFIQRIERLIAPISRICLNSRKACSGAGVSEETERAGSGSAGNGAGLDPRAVAGASRAEADAFARNQRLLIAARLDLTPSEKAELMRHP